MDGETQRPSVQPGGRAPAPGELALVQAFINTHYDLEVQHGADLLATPAAVARWLTERGMIDGGASVSVREHRRAVSAREALRTLAAANPREEPRAVTAGNGSGGDAALQAINDAARGAAVELRFAGDGPVFVPAPGAGAAGALGLVLAIAARAMHDGSWSRLKVCPGVDCGWVFYDHSRNKTGRWCSMSVCGGRAKARSHYRRRRGESGE